MSLRAQRKEIALLRRNLPQGPVVGKYIFQEGPVDLSNNAPIAKVELTDLFDDPAKPLIIYHFMYGAAQKNPCPMCSMWIDGWNSTVKHIKQRANLARVAQAPLSDLRAWAQSRGWENIRLLSATGASFKADMKTANGTGNQFPAITVFTKDDDGAVRHFYSQGAMLPEGNPTGGGLDFLSPVWNLFDILPTGRGDFMPAGSYSDK